MKSGWAPHGDGDPDALGIVVGGGQRQVKPAPILGGFPTTSVYRWLLGISSGTPLSEWVLNSAKIVKKL